jgi:hypothetical protein
MTRFHRATAIALAAGLLSYPQAAATQTVTLDTILSRAADYMELFVERFENVVTEERYDQTVTGSRLQDNQRRRTGSDMAIVKIASPPYWTMFRDVFEVDGKPVRDRVDRLTKLFTDEASTAFEQARRVADESARYNIGPGIRTTNSPLLALLFLQDDLQPRFKFSLGKRDASVGEAVWTVQYQERTHPTIIQGARGVDQPATGRFWINADTGQVLRTEMNVLFDGASYALTTTFAPDPHFGLAVPTEMRERSDMGTTHIIATAAYGKFRSFAVTTDEKAKGN